MNALLERPMLSCDDEEDDGLTKPPTAPPQNPEPQVPPVIPTEN